MIKSLFLTLIVLFIALPNYGQDAKVRKIVAETADNVSFTAWVNAQFVKIGQDIIVNYKVENQSRKAIYLVRENRSEVIFEDDESIIFPGPLVLIGGHEAYDYSFIRVAPGKIYLSKFIIKAGKYPTETRYSEQVWKIYAGFGYVTDISGLRPKEINDPAPYKSLLSQRIRLLALDGLIIEMLEK